jgi:hypothetical protein
MPLNQFRLNRLPNSCFPQVRSQSQPQPAPQLQSLAEALAGTWGITEQYEPDKHHHDA